MIDISKYKQLQPSDQLKPFVHSYWMHANNSSEPEQITISPDSFFKIILMVKENRIVNYFLTGIWTKHKGFIVPPQTFNFGCRLKILAPEFLLNRSISSILNSHEQLDLSFLNLQSFDMMSFELIVQQFEVELEKLISTKDIPANKIRLSQLLYHTKGSLTAAEVSDQIFWSNRQINRYLNKYLGISLKTYLNIQKCYEAYKSISEGNLYPEQDYFDQAHFIKEIKKHTGHTPKSLYKNKNDRFVQLRHIGTY